MDFSSRIAGAPPDSAEPCGSVASAQLEHQNKDPYTQPSEPILFPKLRIYFADFPYLLCSIDQRLLTLET